MAVGKTVKVLGVDPALRNFGFAVATVNLDTDEIENVEYLQLSKTEEDAGKKVRRNSDDLRRANIHAETLREMSDPEKVAVAFVEVPVGSQSARAMASYGICIGVLTNCRCGMIEVTPTEVKVAATNTKTATKEEMIDWAYGKFKDAYGWLTRKTNGKYVLKKENEHLADAIGAINAGLKTSQWKQIKGFLRLSK